MNKIRVGAVILMFSASFASLAKEQRLTYDEDDFEYVLIFDDASISVAQMREVAWLSPYPRAGYVKDGMAPFETSGSGVLLPDGTYVVDKTFFAWLEFCPAVPPWNCEPFDPEVPNAAFMRNAAISLQRADEQVDRLLHMRLPPALEPVRAYLLEHLLLSVERERYRYEYLRSGDIAPMRKLLCRECDCGASEETLLADLQTTADPKLKLFLSTYSWNRQVLACERKTHPPAYPMSAWERFLKDFGITERGP